MKKAEALGGVLYHLDSKTSVMIAPNDQGGPMGKPLPLTELVEKLKIQIIDQVPDLAVAGQLPAQITTLQKYWCIPKDWTFFYLCAHAYYIR